MTRRQSCRLAVPACTDGGSGGRVWDASPTPDASAFDRAGLTGGPAAHARWKTHLANLRQLTFGGENAEALFLRPTAQS